MLAGQRWRRVADGVKLAIAQVHALKFLLVEGPCATSSEYGKLITALVHGAITIHSA